MGYVSGQIMAGVAAVEAMSLNDRRSSILVAEVFKNAVIEWGHCTGAEGCESTRHIHGCFADNGVCDMPEEHVPIAVWSKRALVREALTEIEREVHVAMERFEPFNSGHEGKAVIEEEVEELWEEIKANRSRSVQAHDEAVQIGAMAVRYLVDLRPGT